MRLRSRRTHLVQRIRQLPRLTFALKQGFQGLFCFLAGLSHRWCDVLSGGIRYGHAAEREPFFPGGEPSISGWGPVIGVELYRPLREQLSIYCTARYSAIFGKGRFDDGTPSISQTFNVSEMQLGAQFVRDGLGATRLIARAGCEAQYWSGTLNGTPKMLACLAACSRSASSGNGIAKQPIRRSAVRRGTTLVGNQ